MHLGCTVAIGYLFVKPPTKVAYPFFWFPQILLTWTRPPSAGWTSTLRSRNAHSFARCVRCLSVRNPRSGSRPSWPGLAYSASDEDPFPEQPQNRITYEYRRTLP